MTIQELAIYYTPKSVADAMAYWAIQDKSDTVFDPSYGGCAFLYAACERLEQLDSPSAASQLFGVDIDPNALDYLEKLYSKGAIKEHFIKSNFFDVNVEDLNENGLDVILGNPPYIRYHLLTEEQRGKASEKLKMMEMSITGTASYWAYFLLYSIRFLRNDGRLAMILPGAFLHTSYSQKVRDYLINSFAHVQIYLLQERIFDGTDEESVIICASGAKKRNQSLNVISVENTHELAQYLYGKKQVESSVNSLAGDGGWLRALLTQPELDIYENLVCAATTIRLGEYVGSKLGVVTGRNKYFVLSQNERKERQLPRRMFKPVVNQASHLKRLIVTDKTLKKQESSDTPSLLLMPKKKDLQDPNLVEYLEYGIATGVPQTSHCKRRDNWWEVPNTYSPEVFMPIMSVAWTHLVVNNSKYTCTNNILRLYWLNNEQTSYSWLQLAVGSVSSISQLSAELVGRSYGGGILKLEPQDLSNLVIPILPEEVCNEIAPVIDPLLAKGEIAQATDCVDNILTGYMPQFTQKNLELLREARNRLFIRRRNHKNDISKFIETQSSPEANE